MHPNLGRAVAAGFVGTLVMTLMMYFVSPVMMAMKMDIAAMLGSMLGVSWAAGMMMHFVNGSLIFPAIYTYLLFERLPGSPALRGAMWGTILWIVAQTVVMPMMGAGFFSSQMGGMMAAVGSLVGHLIYGGLLGAVASGPSLRPAHA